MRRFLSIALGLLLVLAVAGAAGAAPRKKAAEPNPFDFDLGIAHIQTVNQGLFFALARGDISYMAALRDQGADPNVSLTRLGLDARGVFGDTSNQAFKAGTNLSGWPILTWAVYLNNMEAVRLLVQAGANVSMPDENGATPLHWAAWAGRHSLAKVLMDNGANCLVRDRQGRTPQDWAVMASQTDMLRLFQNRTCRNIKDSDRDGVPDDRDMCPNTPFGAPVDERGCWIGAYASFFDFDKSVVKKQYIPYIVQAANLIKSSPDLTVRLEGHTDQVGTEEYNYRLGLRRAEAVKRIMVQNGVDPARVTVSSKGKSQPIADNNTARGRAKNRRVEIHASQPGTKLPAQ